MMTSFNRSSKREQIDMQIDQTIVWSILFNEQISVSKVYINPLRKDNNAGAYFEWVNDTLRFVDYAYKVKKLDIYEFIKHRYNLNYEKALNWAFHLYKNNKVKYTSIPQTELDLTNYRTGIESTIKLFYDKSDLVYWEPCDFTSKQLLSDNVYPTIDYTITKGNNIKFVLCTQPTYTLLYPKDNSSIKLLRPYSSPDRKWMSNCNPSLIAGDFDLNCEYLLVTKSYKDYRVLKNLNYNVCYVQSETSNVHELIKLAGIINLIFCYDRDKTGFTSVTNILQSFAKMKLPAYSIVLPKGNFDDPASYYINTNYKTVKQFFDNKIWTILRYTTHRGNIY